MDVLSPHASLILRNSCANSLGCSGVTCPIKLTSCGAMLIMVEETLGAMGKERDRRGIRDGEPQTLAFWLVGLALGIESGELCQGRFVYDAHHQRQWSAQWE